MSYYYNYYVGYKSNGKVYPLGPYNSLGELCCVISVSRSFASELHYDFYKIPEKDMSDELCKEFTYQCDGKVEISNVKMMPISELPGGSFIRKGYYLIEDVQQYEDDEMKYFDGFYDHVTPSVYAAMAQNEAQFGKPEPRKDDFDELYYPKSASDYMYYAYPDYVSEEYEAHMIRQVAEMLSEYTDLPKDAELVALETEG